MTRVVARGRTLAIVIAVALCVAAAFVFVGSQHRDVRYVAADYAGTPVTPPKAVSDFVLVGTNGRPAHLLVGAPLEFLFFGYAHCPDECPLALASLARAYRTLDATERANTRVVFVTVDPSRDTPGVLGRYLAAFDRHFVGLTAAPDALARVWRAYGVTVDAKSKTIGHGDAIYAIDAKNDAVLIYPPEQPASGLASDAKKLAGTPG